MAVDERVPSALPRHSARRVASGGYYTVGHRPDIDGLRAVAVLLVVGYHAGVPWLPGGFIGVDVFFVVSGFLITGLLISEARRTGTISLSGFYARRIRRLLPAAALVLSTTLVLAHLLLSPLAAASADHDAIAAALSVSNMTYAAQTSDYFAAQVDASPLLHFWSLSVEEQFYLLWPVAVLAALGLGAVRVRRGQLPLPALRRVGLILLAVGGVSLLLSARLSEGMPGWSYYGLHTRAWELALGAGVAVGLRTVARLPRIVAVLAGWCGLAVILLAATRYDATTVFPGVAAALPALGCALILLAGLSVPGAGVARILSHPRLVAVGLVSYSLYLWHWPMLTFARALTDDGDPATAPVLAVVVAVALSFGLAFATTRWVENPFRRNATLRDSPRLTFRVGAALVAVPLAIALLPLPTPGPVSLGTPDAPVLTAAGRQVPDTAPRMTPEQAAADLVTGMGDCHQPIEAKPLARPCVFGDPAGDRTIVLVGDSKAQQWFPALDAAARSRGWRLLAWTKSSCALADVEFTSSRGGYAACAAWRNDVLGAIESEARSGGVDLVMIGRSRTYAGILVRNGTPISAPRDEAATWATAVRASLARIPDAGRIALLRDLPWALWDRAQCLSANPVATSQCAFAVTPDAREQALAKAERSVAATDPRVRTVDLTPLACPGGVCRAVSPAGIITFRDQHHLTATYSASLAAGLAKDVARLLNERKTPGA